MRTSIIIKSTSKVFSASCVLLMAGFTSKTVNHILKGAIQIERYIADLFLTWIFFHLEIALLEKFCPLNVKERADGLND